MHSLNAIRKSRLYKENWPRAKKVHGIKADEFLRKLYRAQQSQHIDIEETIAGAFHWAETREGSGWWSKISSAPRAVNKESSKKRELRINI